MSFVHRNLNAKDEGSVRDFFYVKLIRKDLIISSKSSINDFIINKSYIIISIIYFIHKYHYYYILNYKIKFSFYIIGVVWDETIPVPTSSHKNTTALYYSQILQIFITIILYISDYRWGRYRNRKSQSHSHIPKPKPQSNCHVNIMKK